MYGRRFPVRGRRFGRRKSYGRRSYGGGYMSTARRAFSIATKVASLVNTEWKYKDVQQSAMNVSTAGSIQLLTDVSQGDDINTRDGRSILLKNVLIRMTFNKNAAGDARQTLRAIVFRDMNDNDSTAPTLAGVLAYSGGYLGISPLNKDNSMRYRVLRDMVFDLDVNRLYKTTEMWLKFGLDKDARGNRTIGQHATWSGTNGTDTAKGHIYLLLVSTQSGANYPTVTFNSRLGFIDN